jgi:hypothetical protein
VDLKAEDTSAWALRGYVARWDQLDVSDPKSCA